MQCCSIAASLVGLRGSNLRWMFLTARWPCKIGIGDGSSNSASGVASSEHDSSSTSERRISDELYSGCWMTWSRATSNLIWWKRRKPSCRQNPTGTSKAMVTHQFERKVSRTRANGSPCQCSRRISSESWRTVFTVAGCGDERRSMDGGHE